MTLLRNLHLTVNTSHSVNQGSKRYPDWHTEVETTEIIKLQFSTDRGKTWMDVPDAYDEIDVQS